jgi:hypothetical protein
VDWDESSTDLFISVLDRDEVRAALAEQLRLNRLPVEMRRSLRAHAAKTVDSYARQFARDIYDRAGLAWSLG